MNLPDNLPPLPPVPVGFVRLETRSSNWTPNSNVTYFECYDGTARWFGPYKGRPNLLMSVTYLEAVRDEPAKDQSASVTLFGPCKHCRNSMACTQIGQCEIYGITGVEARVCEDIAARQRLGIAKYGCTVEQSPDDMLRHAYEEALDLAVYLKAELERRAR